MNQSKLMFNKRRKRNGKGMKILVISEQIVPYQSVASIRWTKIIKYLKKKNQIEQIDVVTLKKEFEKSKKNAYWIREDELLKKDAIWIDHYYAVSLPFSLKSNSVFGWIKAGAKKIITKDPIRKRCSNVVDLYRQKKIEELVLQYIQKEIQIEIYDFLITSYGPDWTVFVGSKLKQAHPDLCWIADFRDQWYREWNPKNYGRLKRKAQKVIAPADGLFRVNPYLELFESPMQPVFTITNGFDPQEAMQSESCDRFRILYTGTIYTTDDFDALFRCIKELIEGNEMDQNDVVIEYAGPTLSLFYSYIQQYRLENLFVNYDFIARKESLELQSRASILVMAGWNSKKEKIVWSGKMYEYMMARKPIVYLMAGDEQQCEAADQIHRLGGVCYQTIHSETSYLPLKQYILEKYVEWKQSGKVTITREEEYVDEFSYPNIAKKVYKILNALK